ncbi:hypothetical protein [Gordonia polyisoprenivorans]|uniref:hypothetical protein n=1 Tax=Gordonia polyisoprenivorans TaxID=84595 RepID=UPI001AD6A2B3|nr:hypothetical protein [Gordonia polyisoprenivorans]QTI70998.1 hypothetical protein J6U32_11010 [Gordonia polyisoprenivorans]
MLSTKEGRPSRLLLPIIDRRPPTATQARLRVASLGPVARGAGLDFTALCAD